MAANARFGIASILWTILVRMGRNLNACPSGLWPILVVSADSQLLRSRHNDLWAYSSCANLTRLRFIQSPSGHVTPLSPLHANFHLWKTIWPFWAERYLSLETANWHGWETSLSWLVTLHMACWDASITIDRERHGHWIGRRNSGRIATRDQCFHVFHCGKLCILTLTRGKLMVSFCICSNPLYRWSC